MGWLFTVALGMQEQKGSAVAKALVGSPEGVNLNLVWAAALVVMSVVTLLT